MSQADDRGDDLAAFTLGRDDADKTPVDLELVKAQGLQVAQVGVAGAEIVEREPHPIAFSSPAT